MRIAWWLPAVVVLAALRVSAQEAYATRSGQIRFNASTPLEDIEAENTRVNAILKPESGAFGVVLLIAEFEFPRKLMQEHFNENYLESHKYPKATFAGTLQGTAPYLNGESCDCAVSGTLTLHGVARPLTAGVRISRDTSGYRLRSAFTVRPEAHDIKVPKLLFSKIAEEVQVEIDFWLVPGD